MNQGGEQRTTAQQRPRLEPGLSVNDSPSSQQLLMGRRLRYRGWGDLCYTAEPVMVHMWVSTDTLPQPRTMAWRCAACVRTRWRACSSCCSSPSCPLGPWPPPSAACPVPGPSSHPGQQGKEDRVLREGTGGTPQGHCWGGCGLLMGPHPASLPLPSHPSDDYDDTEDDDPFNPQVWTWV